MDLPPRKHTYLHISDRKTSQKQSIQQLSAMFLPEGKYMTSCLCWYTGNTHTYYNFMDDLSALAKIWVWHLLNSFADVLL